MSKTTGLKKPKTHPHSKGNYCPKEVTTEWEKIFSSCISDQGWISKVYKEIIQLTKIPDNPIFTMGRGDLNTHFPKEDMHVASRHMKTYSAPAIVRKVQKSEPQWGIALDLLEWLSSKKIKAASAGEDMEKRGPLYSARIITGVATFKQYGDSSKGHE